MSETLVAMGQEVSKPRQPRECLIRACLLAPELLATQHSQLWFALWASVRAPPEAETCSFPAGELCFPARAFPVTLMPAVPMTLWPEWLKH